MSITTQLTFRRTASASYTDRQGNARTAEPNEPRFDYAADGAFLGLLIQGDDQAGAAETLIGTSDAFAVTPFSCRIKARVNPVNRVQTLYQADDGTITVSVREPVANGPFLAGGEPMDVPEGHCINLHFDDPPQPDQAADETTEAL